MINNKRKHLLELLKSRFTTRCVKLLFPLIPEKLLKKVLLIYRQEHCSEECRFFFDKIIISPELFHTNVKFMTLISLELKYKQTEFKRMYSNLLNQSINETCARDIYDLNRSKTLLSEYKSNFTVSEVKIFKLAHQNFHRWCNNESQFLNSNMELVNYKKDLIVSIPFHIFNFNPKDPSLQNSVSNCFRIIYKELEKSKRSYIPFLQHDTHFNYFTPTQGVTYHTNLNGLNLLQIKESPLRNYLNIDGHGYSGWISYNNNLKDLDQLIREYPKNLTNLKNLNDIIESKETKYNQEDIEETLPKNFLFFPTQVSNDKVAELANIKTEILLELIIENAHKFNYSIVIKRHPKDQNEKMTKLFNKGKKIKNIIISKGNIHTLIKESNACLTVNSGAGLEALLHKKHVISTGLSDYTIATKYISSDQDLISYLRAPFNEPDVDFIDKFLSFYLDNHIFKFNNEKKITKKLNSFLEKLDSK